MQVSDQQGSILKWLLRCVRAAESNDPELLARGFVWGLRLHGAERENSQRASFSRSLARLEQRGLITRLKGSKAKRTRRVLLTAEGRKVAESLA